MYFHLNKQIEQQKQDMEKQKKDFEKQIQQLQQPSLNTMFMTCQPQDPNMTMTSTPAGPNSLQSTAMSNLGIGQGSFNPNLDPNFFQPINLGGWDWRQMRPLPPNQPTIPGGTQPQQRPFPPQPFSTAPRIPAPPGLAPGNQTFPINLSQVIPATGLAVPAGTVNNVPSSTAQPPPADSRVTTTGAGNQNSAGNAQPPVTTGPSNSSTSATPAATAAGAAGASSETPDVNKETTKEATVTDGGKDAEEILSIGSSTSHHYEDINETDENRRNVEKVLSRSRQGKNDPFKSTTESEEEPQKEFFFEGQQFECEDNIIKLIHQMHSGDEDACNAIRLLHSFAIENKDRADDEHFRDTLLYILTKAAAIMNSTHLSYNTVNKLTEMAKDIGQMWRNFHNSKAKTRKKSGVYDNNVKLLVTYGFAEKSPEKVKQTRRKRTSKKKESDNGEK